MGPQILAVEITDYPEAVLIFFGLVSGRQSEGVEVQVLML